VATDRLEVLIFSEFDNLRARLRRGGLLLKTIRNFKPGRVGLRVLSDGSSNSGVPALLPALLGRAGPASRIDGRGKASDVELLPEFRGSKDNL